ncbi:thioesterase family protein [Nocardioides jishulii]|uniref:Thioesterase n=1 Tax=Nocardioides jishulii TaxID=2575440 RepID=A0A4U2YQJ1_9ACTN|nr:thioesterase family protein [Nocardioides jishulii]QCX26534.1 thioesterase [Nocardioides jishulii]TKI63659.1 thioesterase [Nocardioides jishulii]
MALPRFDQLCALPAYGARTVTADDLDLNGHMNAAHFITAQIRAVRSALAEVGVDEAYVTERRMGTFAAEHNIRYLGELRLGDEFSVRVRFLDRTAKTVHGAAFLVDETKGRLATVLEVVTVHVDQETRRSTPMPDDLTQAIDARIAEGEALGWTLEPRLSLRR